MPEKPHQGAYQPVDYYDASDREDFEEDLAPPEKDTEGSVVDDLNGKSSKPKKRTRQNSENDGFDRDADGLVNPEEYPSPLTLLDNFHEARTNSSLESIAKFTTLVLLTVPIDVLAAAGTLVAVIMDVLWLPVALYREEKMPITEGYLDICRSYVNWLIDALCDQDIKAGKEMPFVESSERPNAVTASAVDSEAKGSSPLLDADALLRRHSDSATHVSSGSDSDPDSPPLPPPPPLKSSVEGGAQSATPPESPDPQDPQEEPSKPKSTPASSGNPCTLMPLPNCGSSSAPQDLSATVTASPTPA